VWFQAKIRVIVGVAVATVLLSACKSQQVQSEAGPPPVPVTISKAVQQSVPIDVRVIGTVEASATVQVKSQIAGQLVSVKFTEGQNVRKGDLLFEIDARPYLEALRQAEAAVAKDRAQIAQSEAILARDLAQSKNADAEAARYDELVKAGDISKSQYDRVRTSANVYKEAVHAAQAAIESARAALQSDIAAVEKAKLDISYCQIRSPISGRAGNLLVHAGNLVQENGDNPLVVIHQVEPIFVSFSVPEQHLGDIRSGNARQKLSVRIVPQHDTSKELMGRLSVVDNQVDTSTGTIRLKAVLDNTQQVLWPGQFVNVVLTLDTLSNVTVIPAEAVQQGQQGQFVYVVKTDGTVEPRVVSAGRSFDRKIIVEKGVSAGETVVTDGQLRLFPGAHIQPVDPEKIDKGTL
jgi:multidrug efflux system membrane fusion protein